jgi:ATP-dependent DNA ligase
LRGSPPLAVRAPASARWCLPFVKHCLAPCRAFGTGISHAVLRQLYDRMLPLRTNRSPFKQRIKDEAVTSWVKPKLVAEVKFTEWTAAGEMRHPSFLGVREDKRPQDVVREKRGRSDASLLIHVVFRVPVLVLSHACIPRRH